MRVPPLSRTGPRGAYAAVFFASRLLWRAAAFLWISPLAAARSSIRIAFWRSSALEPSAWAFFSAVRSADRWARLRTFAARDFRMFFFAEAMFGTTELSKVAMMVRARDGPERPES